MKIQSPHIEKKREAHYQVVVIGGGIVGAGIFRDLCLHNIKTLLVDKGDFAAQTSHRSSKMLHGGLRYLETLELFLVWEALHEKNRWLQMAPHLAQEKAFHLLNYKDSKYPLWMNALALWAYDFLSGFKNSPSRILNKNETIEYMPDVKTEGLRGSGMYYDAIVDDNKLALESIFDGVIEGGDALNYFELTRYSRREDGTYLLHLRDNINNMEETVTCNKLVFAIGPFTDQVMHKLEIPWKDVILPSKGIHLWIKKESLNIKNIAVIQTKDNRLVFVIPRERGILVGTTEEITKEDYFDIQVQDREIDYLLENLSFYFPKASITRDDIISSYAGVRPLVSIGSRDAHKVSRHHKVIKPLPDIFVIVGGKLTTFRNMARTVVKPLLRSMGLKYDKVLSKNIPRQKSVVTHQTKVITDEMIKSIIENEFVRTVDDVVLRRLNLVSDKEIDEYRFRVQSLTDS